MRKLRVPLAIAMACGGLGSIGCVFDPIQRSHVDANAPSERQFDRLLRRDVGKYFASSKGKGLTVEHAMLRNGPTQSGIAYPKYYVWATARRGRRVVAEGALRLAAIDGQRFEVTDFVDVQEMRRNPAKIESVFPSSVCDVIRARLRRAPKP